jgi:hypothetical protein
MCRQATRATFILPDTLDHAMPKAETHLTMIWEMWVCASKVGRAIKLIQRGINFMVPLAPRYSQDTQNQYILVHGSSISAVEL